MARKQPQPLHYPDTSRGLNNFTIDRNLQRYLQRVYPDMLARKAQVLESLGAFAAGRLDEQAEYSDRIAPPVLKRDLDRTVAPQKRVSRVVLNEEYKDCQQEIYRHGILASCFDPAQPEPHMLAFLAQYLVSYSDISTGCPLAMTHPDALLLATRAPQPVRDKFLPQFLRTDGHTMIGGTWATEWAGGSDVRRNTKTEAVLVDKDSFRCAVDGRNFFTSAMGFDSWGGMKTVRFGKPGKDGEKEEIALVFIPRFTDEKWDEPEQHRMLNNVSVTHLKEKSGTEGLATAEVEMDGATGYLVADEKNGLRAMMEALGCSRVHNAMAAAGVMHRAYVEAMCWVTHRRTFGQTLDNYEDIQEDLLKLKTEWLGGAALAFEAARSFDDALHDKTRRTWLRVVTALAKYRTAEQATESTALATEIIGGIGYTKDHPIERIHRDAMVLRVWEGPKNIQARELVAVLRGGGDKAFIQRLDKIAKELPQEMSWEKSRLTYIRDKMDSALKHLMLCPERDGIAGQRYMKDMARALTYALLCEEAGHEIRLHNDISKQLVAKDFYDEHYRTEIKPSLNRSELHRHFNAVAQGLPIPARPEAENEADAPPAPKPGGNI